MRHPDEGVLRRLVDEPAAVPEADRRHVAGCERCTADLAGIRDDAEQVQAALATATADLDLDAAWRRLTADLDAPAPRVVRPGRRLRSVARRPVVAGVAVAAIVAGAGAAAANDWFEIFRTERVEPIGVELAELHALPDLSAYGEVEVTGDPDLRVVDGEAAAEAATGLDVPEVADLPDGVVGEPTYRVADEVSATFTFSEARAARATGDDLPPPPPGVEGSRVRLVAGPGLAAMWTQRSGAPALVVGRAAAPTAYSSSVPFDVLRDYLLSLPGLPDQVGDGLRAFNADGSTLPLPVPARLAVRSTTTVDGKHATVLATRDRTLAAVVWVDDGVVTVVAGTLDAGEVVEVARSLR